MAAPTFVAEYEASSWTTTTTPKTVTPTTNAGDTLLVFSAAADSVATLGTPSGNGNTYTAVVSKLLASNVQLASWKVDSAAAGTAWTLSASRGGTAVDWGFDCLRWSGSAGIGASNSGNGTGNVSFTITTTQANSAVVVLVGDWNADVQTTRTWATINGITPTAGNGLEIVIARDAAQYSVYAAYWSDVGAAGSKTITLNTTGTMKWSAIAIEIKGSAGVSHSGVANITGQVTNATNKIAVKTGQQQGMVQDSSVVLKTAVKAGQGQVTAQSSSAGSRTATKASAVQSAVQSRAVGAKVASKTSAAQVSGQTRVVGGTLAGRSSLAAVTGQSVATGRKVATKTTQAAGLGQSVTTGGKLTVRSAASILAGTTGDAGRKVATSLGRDAGVLQSRPTGQQVAGVSHPGLSNLVGQTRALGVKLAVRGCISQGVVTETTPGRALRAGVARQQAAGQSVGGGRRSGAGVARSVACGASRAVSGSRSALGVSRSQAALESRASFSSTPARALAISNVQFMGGRYEGSVLERNVGHLQFRWRGGHVRNSS